MADELLSHGAGIFIQTDDDPVTFTLIEGVQGVQAPSLTRALIDVTALESEAKEYIVDLPDAEEITFTMYAKKGVTAPTYKVGQEAVYQASLERVAVNFKVTIPQAEQEFEFSGLVRDFRPKVESASAYEIDVTIKPTGAVVRSATA